MALRAAEKRRLAWLDLETTGFTDLSKHMVYKHKILEIGLAVTDEHFNALAELSLVVRQDVSQCMALADDIVMQMHTANGLWDECATGHLTLAQAEQKAIEFLSANGVSAKSSPLCGNGIQFDRMFLEAQLPALNGYLHYRNLDISATKELLKTISPDLEPPKNRAHRALDDIRESIAEGKVYRELIMPLVRLRPESTAEFGH